VFLVAHLVYLPSTLEDIDSLNFALGIHDFDPARHQPHPPGYPVFIALAKMARVVLPSDAAALAILGAVFGALAVFPMVRICQDIERLGGRTEEQSTMTAALAALVLVVSPLYWFNASRPMSDIPGLATVLAAQAALVSAFVRQRLNPNRTPEAVADSGKMIVLGAFLSALAIGMRSQALWLTVPLLGLVLLQRAGRGAAGALLGSAMTFGIGILIWAIPLVIASGGPRAYITAITAQGGEDFAGVDMLYLNPTGRRLALNLLDTFIYPWASRPLGWTVFVFAAVGAVVLLLRARRTVVLLAVMAGPYLVVHLLVQETLTTRYALPLIPVVAYLVVRGAEAVVPTFKSAGVSIVVGILAVWSVAVTLPSVRVYAREGAPVFAAIRELERQLPATPGVVGFHQAMQRSMQAEHFNPARVLPSPPMREWLELASYWREGHVEPVWFLADPPRTDIELIDPLSRRLHAHYIWNFPRLLFMGGSRPDIVDLIQITSPPGWFAEEGWHLTPETLTTSERLGRREATAYIRSRPDGALMVLGAASTGAAADVSIAIDGRALDTIAVPAGGRILRRLHLKPGDLAGDGALRKFVATYATPDGRPQQVRLTEFAIAPADALIAVQHAGWHEIEYSKELQRRWRWTSAAAETFINSAGRDVTLRVAGESPLRYFDAAPRITIRAGTQVLTTAEPSQDFEIAVKIPAAVLASSDGMVTIATDKTFVPNERSGSPDRRTLGLRIFDLRVE
jgi:hypothetical protein